MGGDNDTPCDKCKKLHRKSVCGLNGVTYDNICAAKNCAEFDPVEVVVGPCSMQVIILYEVASCISNKSFDTILYFIESM